MKSIRIDCKELIKKRVYYDAMDTNGEFMLCE